MSRQGKAKGVYIMKIEIEVVDYESVPQHLVTHSPADIVQVIKDTGKAFAGLTFCDGYYVPVFVNTKGSK